MIPEGYTYETFAAWITEEIFFEDTEGLGLADIRGASPESYKELYFLGTGWYGTYIPYNGAIVNNGDFTSPVTPEAGDLMVFDIRPSPFAFEYGEQITLENGIVLEVRGNEDWQYFGAGSGEFNDQQVTYGDILLPAYVVSVPEGTTIYEGVRMRLKTGEAVDRIPNPVFNAILAQALGQMGLTDISEINIGNMYEFRQRAILETIKIVTENNAALYPFASSTDDSVYYGGTLPDQLLTLLSAEEAQFNAYIDHKRSLESQGNFNVVEEGLSSTSEVKVVW